MYIWWKFCWVKPVFDTSIPINWRGVLMCIEDRVKLLMVFYHFEIFQSGFMLLYYWLLV